MALTAFPTLKFNTSTGSDTLASGSGPDTAITCLVNGATTNSTTIVVDNASGNLDTIAQDGSAALFVTGIGFVRISTTNNGTNTIVVETALTIGDNVQLAIGGKRATIGDTDSRRLFAATSSPTASGGSGQWIVVLEDDQSISSAITMSFTAGIGALTIQGDSTISRRTITQTGNATHLSVTAANRINLNNCVFRNSNSTKNEVFTSSVATTIRFENCVIGHAGGTDCPKSVGIRSASAYTCVLWNTSALRLTGTGINLTNSVLEMYGSEISRCGGNGVTSVSGSVFMDGSIISHNTGDGIKFSAVPTRVLIRHSTVHANSGAGIDMAGANNTAPQVIIINNQITANGAYGVTLPGTAPHFTTIEFNNFGNASDSTNNTSGTLNGQTLPGSNTTIAPGYTDASAGTRNFGIASAAKATGFPASSATVAAGQTGSTSYVDIGAVQRQESGGGAAGRRNMRGGFIN